MTPSGADALQVRWPASPTTEKPPMRGTNRNDP